MKLTVALLAVLTVSLSASPVMASVADSSASNGGYQATHHRHHHHHRRHHRLDDSRSDVMRSSAIG